MFSHLRHQKNDGDFHRNRRLNRSSLFGLNDEPGSGQLNLRCVRDVQQTAVVRDAVWQRGRARDVNL